ncbi:hypothetical protein, conserved [Leishmania donovani]|uniref:Uncharacterized protein n=1 Tax=Leishmania donovani TaxID=5661 RepID=E9BRQ7_LEIDO|nr:hypothetical protein, conserved [Leishmania donovani]TPP44315.1 hypothetical protein CGC21_5740 [Leishmania donovani]CBZ37936.1 hypothetical protein, conserved [Leishmania donovani]
MSTSTRRISVTSEQLQSDALRAQLFSACCAYGVVEWAQYQEDPNYNTTTVHIQFQKLSSADRLRSDVQQRGRLWQIESEPAALCVGTDVLLSAAEVLRLGRLTAALPGFACTALIGVTVSNTSTAATAKQTPSLPTFEEKSFLLHGRSTASRTTPASSKVTAEQEAALWSGFEQESSEVRHSCLGPYCAVLHFGSPRDANEFLCQHQLILAEQHSVYAIHVGTAPGCALAVALPKMLARHALADCAVDGRVVRGYVVAMHSSTYCVVDAGLYPSADQASITTLVHTHTNFLSVSLGDEVQVQLSASGGLTMAEKGMVGGKLLRVTSASAFSTRRSVTKAQLPNTAARTLRTSNLAHGLVGAASSPHQPQARPASGGRATDVAGAVRRGTLNNKPNATVTGGGNGGAVTSKPAGGAAAKALASKLFRSIQQKRSSGGDSEGNSAERICAYPAGLGAYARLLVRVERIEEDGLHARCVDDAENCGYAGPVFIPAAFVPADTSSTGQGWRTFAVVGERMHVALLYMVAVGGSAATMRGVASKKEADLRHAAAAAVRVTPGDVEGASVTAGTTVMAMTMLKLSAGDLGVPAADHTSPYFPAFLLYPGLHAPASLRQTVLLLPSSDLGSLDPATLSTLPASLIVSEVVNDVMRGQYAVVVPCAVYAARQAQRAAAQEQRKTAEVDEVKRRLAAVMGQDILKVLNAEDGPAAKRPRAGD